MKLLLSIALACLWCLYPPAAPAQQPAAASVPSVQPEATPVATAPLGELVIHPEISAPARVLSLGDSRISAELSAVVDTVAAQVGERVAADSVLALLDCDTFDLRAAELDARLRALDARIDFAAAQAQRARELERKRTLAQETTEQRVAELAALRAERDAQRALLDSNARDRARCAVRAPFNAVVLERFVSRGEYVTPGTPLFRLLDVERLEISSAVLSQDADSLAASPAVAFRYRDVDYPVELRTLLPAIDAATGSREARLVFVDTGTADAGTAGAGKVLSGTVGRLVWRAPAALPADYLTLRDGRLGVLLAADGRARFHPLPGARQGRPAGVGELPQWWRVITDGRFGLDDGDLIETIGDG